MKRIASVSLIVVALGTASCGGGVAVGFEPGAGGAGGTTTTGSAGKAGTGGAGGGAPGLAGAAGGGPTRPPGTPHRAGNSPPKPFSPHPPHPPPPPPGGAQGLFLQHPPRRSSECPAALSAPAERDAARVALSRRGKPQLPRLS